MGHTEAVAMTHYRQSTGKASEKFFDQVAGESPTDPPIFQGYSTKSPTIQGIGETPQMTPTGLEPVPRP